MPDTGHRTRIYCRPGCGLLRAKLCRPRILHSCRRRHILLQPQHVALIKTNVHARAEFLLRTGWLPSPGTGVHWISGRLKSPRTRIGVAPGSEARHLQILSRETSSLGSGRPVAYGHHDAGTAELQDQRLRALVRLRTPNRKQGGTYTRGRHRKQIDIKKKLHPIFYVKLNSKTVCHWPFLALPALQIWTFSVTGIFRLDNAISPTKRPIDGKPITFCKGMFVVVLLFFACCKHAIWKKSKCRYIYIFF